MALRLENVSARYGGALALRSVSLSIERGEAVALVGPNGSGKSTLLAVAAGWLVGEGTVTINGVSSRDAMRYARQLGYVPQESALYDDLTARQNLEFFGSLYGLGHCANRGLAQANLSDRGDERVRNFSGGMKQRLSIAVALLHDPAVVLLDEPTAALDRASREHLWDQIRRLRDDHRAVLMTTHHDEDAAEACDRVIHLDAGEIVPHRPRWSEPRVRLFA